MGELERRADIQVHDVGKVGEIDAFKSLVFCNPNVVNDAKDVATLRKSGSEFGSVFWITEVGTHELTPETRRCVSRDADDFQPAVARASAAALPIPFDAPVMTIDRVIKRSSEFYADLLFWATDSLLPCIVFTRSAADAPSSDSP